MVSGSRPGQPMMAVKFQPAWYQRSKYLRRSPLGHATPTCGSWRKPHFVSFSRVTRSVSIARLYLAGKVPIPVDKLRTCKKPDERAEGEIRAERNFSGPFAPADRNRENADDCANKGGGDDG